MRTEGEMQITLARLRDEFSVDVAPALELHGEALAAWLELVEDALFEREFSSMMSQTRQVELREEHRLLLKASYRKDLPRADRIARRDEIDALFLAAGLVPPNVDER